MYDSQSKTHALPIPSGRNKTKRGGRSATFCKPSRRHDEVTRKLIYFHLPAPHAPCGAVPAFDDKKTRSFSIRRLLSLLSLDFTLSFEPLHLSLSHSHISVLGTFAYMRSPATSERLAAVMSDQSTMCTELKQVSNKRKESPSSTSSPSSPTSRKSRVLEAVRDRLEEEQRKAQMSAQPNSSERHLCHDTPDLPSNNSDDDEEEELRAEREHDEAQAALEAEREEYYNSGRAYEDYLAQRNGCGSVE
jgi:hypothetical protein